MQSHLMPRALSFQEKSDKPSKSGRRKRVVAGL
jgi:hypothetical protein